MSPQRCVTEVSIWRNANWSSVSGGLWRALRVRVGRGRDQVPTEGSLALEHRACIMGDGGGMVWVPASTGTGCGVGRSVWAAASMSRGARASGGMSACRSSCASADARSPCRWARRSALRARQYPVGSPHCVRWTFPSVVVVAPSMMRHAMSQGKPPKAGSGSGGRAEGAWARGSSAAGDIDVSGSVLRGGGQGRARHQVPMEGDIVQWGGGGRTLTWAGQGGRKGCGRTGFGAGGRPQRGQGPRAGGASVWTPVSAIRICCHGVVLHLGVPIWAATFACEGRNGGGGNAGGEGSGLPRTCCPGTGVRNSGRQSDTMGCCPPGRHA